MKRIFDCFTFFNELDILDLRLQECYDAVDYFVICEGTQSFQGKPKPLHYLENESRFEKFKDKIIYRIVDEMPTGSDPWAREHFQRNYIRKAVTDFGVQKDDIVIVTDADEILNPLALSILRNNDGYFQILMPMYQFYMNYLVPGVKWSKPYAGSWRLIEQIKDISLVRTQQKATFEMFGAESRVIDPGGWHFTFLGGAARVREKLSAYSHTESSSARLIEQGKAEQLIQAGFDNGGRSLTKYQDIDASFPKTVTDNTEYYQNLGLIKAPLDRIAEFERIFQDLSDEIRAERSRNRELFGKVAGLVNHANALLKPYQNPHYRGIKFGGPNLIPASREFSREWFGGVQSQGAAPSQDVPHFIFGNVVMRHYRDDAKNKGDNNVGWYNVEKSQLELGVTYTASCYIWIPATSSITSAYITLSLCETQSSQKVNPALTETWQRISTSALFWTQSFESKWQQSTTLRVNGDAGAIIYSTCWQFEVGTAATPYQETRPK
jgi:hypothetical protein